jgi:hypothetical protein
MKTVGVSHEKFGDFVVSLEALVGLLVSAGLLAVILRVATGKW